MIRAVIFDFDGVIADSEPLHFRAFRDVLSAERVVLTEDDYYSQYLGYDDAGVFQAVGDNRHVGWKRDMVASLVARKAVRLEELERGESILFPGAAEAVRRLAAIVPLAIASGALGAEIRRVLVREQLDACFAAIVSAEDTPVSKPAADPYLRAVELLSAATGVAFQPAECLAIEDSRWGLQSARAAGLRTIGVTHTYHAADLPGADLIIPNLDDLTKELLDRFN